MCCILDAHLHSIHRAYRETDSVKGQRTTLTTFSLLTAFRNEGKDCFRQISSFLSRNMLLASFIMAILSDGRYRIVYVRLITSDVFSRVFYCVLAHVSTDTVRKTRSICIQESLSLALIETAIFDRATSKTSMSIKSSSDGFGPPIVQHDNQPCTMPLALSDRRLVRLSVELSCSEVVEEELSLAELEFHLVALSPRQGRVCLFCSTMVSSSASLDYFEDVFVSADELDHRPESVQYRPRLRHDHLSNDRREPHPQLS